MNKKIGPLTQTAWKRLLIALLIGVLAVWLRTNMAIYGPIEADEPAYVDTILQYSHDFHNGDWNDILQYDGVYEHPVFYKMAYGLLMPAPKTDSGISMIYDTPITESLNFFRLLYLRLISVVFGVLTVILLALINPLAGLMLAIDSFAVKYTSVIYLEALPLFLCLICMVTAGKWLDENDADNRLTRRRFGWLLISAAVLGLAAASKYIYTVTGFAVVAYGLYRAFKLKSPKVILQILVWGLLAVLFFFIGDPYLWSDPLGRLQQSIGFNNQFSATHAVYPVWQPLLWLLLPIPQQPSIHAFARPGNFLVLLDTLFFPLAILGIGRLARRYPLFFLWLVFGLLFLLIWPTKWPQYILLVLAPFCLSAGLGWSVLKEWLNKVFLKL